MILGKVHLYNTKITFDLLDAGSVMYHPNYLVVCDRSRNCALDMTAYSFLDLWKSGLALAVKEANSVYLKPAQMNQTICVETSLTSWSPTSLRISQKLYETHEMGLNRYEVGNHMHSKQYIYSLDLLLVCVRLHPLRATRIPEELKAALSLVKEVKNL